MEARLVSRQSRFNSCRLHSLRSQKPPQKICGLKEVSVSKKEYLHKDTVRRGDFFFDK